MACREYVRSLINNLSLLSGKVLVPSEYELQRMCGILRRMQRYGLKLDEKAMKHLIYGPEPKGNESQKMFYELKELITQIKVKNQ